jgi:hypothetical protein
MIAGPGTPRFRVIYHLNNVLQFACCDVNSCSAVIVYYVRYM